MCAVHFNPEDFKHITMMINGHDSRATYINAADRAMYYSYKLKKSGFRTQIRQIFQRFNGKSVIRVSDINTFTIQFKLACVLHNVKKFVRLGSISSNEHHTYWMQQNFDYNNASSNSVYDTNVNVNLEDKQNDAQIVRELQQ
ncbi:hypothetical protein DFQ28_000886 [Apophysomyces sp. BC1034]|nr:hypothetical protein DFQ29_000606 [Apophysomyces sp. BC1021]KAG0183804.1 hypothetical protein DFQ28_000886 [Apophysomyces sp. BC1034]